MKCKNSKLQLSTIPVFSGRCAKYNVLSHTTEGLCAACANISREGLDLRMLMTLGLPAQYGLRSGLTPPVMDD